MQDLILAPSILSADFMHLQDAIEATLNAGAGYIHFDVMDGQFVPNISFGIPVLKSVRKGTDAVLDVHLMITEPERYIPRFAEAGADIITFHLEATRDAAGCIRMIHEAGAKAGIVLKPATPVEEAAPYLKDVEMVLLMSVEPGFGGQSFIPETFEKISRLRAMCENDGLSVDIEVDGGIGAANAADVVAAGANVLVAGSAVFRGEIAENTIQLSKAMQGGRQA